MTTIAWCGKELAVDSQTTETYTKDYVPKMWDWGRGKFCICGDYADYPIVQSSLNQDEDPVEHSKKSTVIWIDSNCPGKVFYTEQKTTMEQVNPYAWGSGAAFALGAMAAGKTASEAVSIAAKYDIYTGGDISRIKV